MPSRKESLVVPVEYSNNVGAFNHHNIFHLTTYYMLYQECTGSVIERLTRDRGVAGSSLNGFVALCPRVRHINHCLVLVQPRKTHPDITEKVLTGT